MSRFTHTQFERFTAMLTTLKGVGIEPQIRHCCNSAATAIYPEMHLDAVRPGIILYGLLPSPALKGRINLLPAMKMKTVVSMVKTIEKDETVSYGRTYSAPSQRRIATATC